MLAGQVSVGAWASVTVTVKLLLALLPLASLTEQLTVVVPAGKVEPDCGVHDGVPTPEQLSDAVGAG